MNITVNTTALAQELRLINQVVPAKSTIPILMNVHMLAHEGTLHLYGTDHELGFSTACYAEVAEGGEITLPAKTLLDLVEQLPDTEMTIALQGKHVHVSSGAFRSRLQTYPADDFPQPPLFDGAAHTLATAALQGAINKVRYAISDKSATYVIKGALFTLDAGVAALVATDGKRLSVATMPNANGNGAVSVLIPTKTLEALTKLFSEPELEFAQNSQHLFFKAGHRMLHSRMIDGKFPAYQRIIPKECPIKTSVPRAALMAALRRVTIASPDAKLVFLDFAEGLLTISSNSVEIGEAAEELPLEYSADPLRLHLSGEHFLEFLDQAHGAAIGFELKSKDTPMLVTDGQSYLNVIVLMKG